MSSNKRRRVENEEQSGSSGQCIGAEMDSLKQRNKKLESNNQILRAQNEFLRAHVSNDKLLLLQQMTKRLTNGVTIDMSLSSVQSLENNKRRDSFSDRVCDDLSEVILQFLPIEHKFYFECVSKQFQRTVFQKQYELIIEDVMRKNPKRFETIVQKLPNIKSLKSPVNLLNNEEIEVIIKNCNHLIELNIALSNKSTEMLKSFADRFGPQLTSITIFDKYNKSIINSMVNIQEIKAYIDVERPKDLIDFYTQFNPKNLKKLFICFEYSDPLDLEEINSSEEMSDIQSKYFKTLIENNKSITHLSLIFDGYIERYSDGPFDISLGCISQLNQLISLRIVCNIESESIETFDSFESDLKEILVNCHKLKSLSLSFISNVFSKNDFMSEIKKLNELKRFEFNIKDYSSYYKPFEDYFINSLKTGFEDLTHLTIELTDYVFNKHFLDNIDISLPKLQNLIIRNQVKATERTADTVSRLSKLEVLTLNIRHKKNENKYFIVLFETKILEKCKKIKSLELYYIYKQNLIKDF